MSIARKADSSLPVPALAARLFQHADVAHDHAAVSGLAHVVDGAYGRRGLDDTLIHG